MFKKGCFELGATIYPVVIKVKPLTPVGDRPLTSVEDSRADNRSL